MRWTMFMMLIGKMMQGLIIMKRWRMLSKKKEMMGMQMNKWMMVTRLKMMAMLQMMLSM